MAADCRNCGHPEASSHDLLLRGDADVEVYLCGECHDALEKGFVWPGDSPPHGT